MQGGSVRQASHANSWYTGNCKEKYFKLILKFVLSDIIEKELEKELTGYLSKTSK